ncbi:G-type lectin S-receptor-like serine/threonine-protein kinase At1g34300 [Impatiens glandulifera]|uniref:G-type lectin S-receptor-like serine/threonine-protein kinase At1g34300 n=1 Tax=Impatiens glandulifera TaxID=253017 RepID=UPI001FB0D5D7|nr:G-type lectin S-receptor-like serine/threonine-protein kinase At1g34300 [Impatiens glandulifera]
MNLSFLLLLLLLFIRDITAADISPGSTLSASNLNQTWNSPDNSFAFGFIRDGSTYFAAITYGGIPVWKAGGQNQGGGAADSTATLQFLSNGDLRLVNGSSNSLVWQSNTTGRGVTAASLDDSGNLLLKNGSITVWSSFENPTDTLLPTQNFTVDKKLVSGSYSFGLLNSGNLTLTWNSTIVYWNFQLNTSAPLNLSSPTLSLQPIGTLSLSDSRLSSPLILAYSSDFGEGTDILRFLRMDSDGNLRIYSSSKGSQQSLSKWAAISDQCQVFGYCGNLGVCSYNDSGPICNCPSRNFEPIDPNDSLKGCRRKIEIEDCPGNATMLDLPNTKFLTYPPELPAQVFFVGISACRLNCLVSSSCIASTSLADGSGLCYVKVPAFVSAYQSAALPSTSYVKVCGPVDPNLPTGSSASSQTKSWKLKPWLVFVIVLCTILGFVVFEGSLWWWCCRNSPKFGSLAAQYALLEYASGAPVQFSYKELQRSTKGFKEKLGEGGFGAVYKGILANRTVVAVKQLEGIEQGEKQFRMEVATISSTHHLNLVRLIGFCSEGRHRLLVYEFMKNGSLDSFLFASNEGQQEEEKVLNWEARFGVILGTARGITYLHEECRDCIVHCDIKPENILLDDNYNAKVSDFGLAKLINPKDHRYRTLKSVRGTRGYLPPEWLANLPITSKSDVYSFGMVLLEIVSGRRNFDVSDETNRKKFSIWAFEEFEKGNISGILDKRLDGNVADMDQVYRAIKISFLCIQEQPAYRPSMGKVVQMLEGITEIERPPIPRTGEVNISGTNSSVIIDSLSPVSTIAAASAPVSYTSFQAEAGVNSSFQSRKDTERTSSSLLKPYSS